MRPVEAISKLHYKIIKLWKSYPELRFFQYVFYLEKLVREELGYEGDLFYLEDKKLEDALDKILLKTSSKNSK